MRRGIGAVAISRKAVLPRPCHPRVAPQIVKCMVNTQLARRVDAGRMDGKFPLRGFP